MIAPKLDVDVAVIIGSAGLVAQHIGDELHAPLQAAFKLALLDCRDLLESPQLVCDGDAGEVARKLLIRQARHPAKGVDVPRQAILVVLQPLILDVLKQPADGSAVGKADRTLLLNLDDIVGGCRAHM